MKPTNSLPYSESFENLRVLIDNLDQQDTASSLEEICTSNPQRNCVPTSPLPAAPEQRAHPVQATPPSSHPLLPSNLATSSQPSGNTLLQLRQLLADEGFSTNSRLRESVVRSRLEGLQTTPETLIEVASHTIRMEDLLFLTHPSPQSARHYILHALTKIYKNTNVDRDEYLAIKNGDNNARKIIKNLLSL